MTTQEKIVKFMRLKQEAIKRTGCHYDYMTHEIEIDVLSWSDEDAHKVWNGLVDHIMNYSAISIVSYTCPYCFLILSKTEANTIDSIKNFFHKNYISIDEILSNDIYRNII